MADGGDKHPGMMGDGTEEQNLGQPGQPEARIRKDEVEEAFGKSPPAATGKVGDQVSNDMSDAKTTPADTTPKDNSHNFN